MSALAIVALSLGYALGAVLATCRVATLLAYHWMQAHNRGWSAYSSHQLASPNGDQWFGAAAIGLVAGVAWPLIAVAFAARGFLFRPPSDILAARQRERIAELEKELSL